MLRGPILEIYYYEHAPQAQRKIKPCYGVLPPKAQHLIKNHFFSMPGSPQGQGQDFITVCLADIRASGTAFHNAENKAQATGFFVFYLTLTSWLQHECTQSTDHISNILSVRVIFSIGALHPLDKNSSVKSDVGCAHV